MFLLETIGLAGVPGEAFFPGLTGGSSFDSAMRKSIPILTTLADGLRGLANRLLKSPPER